MTTDYDIACEWHERCDGILREFVSSFRAHGRKRSKWRISWRRVDGESLARIWLVYGKRGTVFDSEGLARITEQVLSLIPRLSVANAVSGHSPQDMRPEAEDELGRAFTDKQWERFIDGMEDGDGQWFVSDYGLKPMEILWQKLLAAESDEQKLLIIDRILNVVHQRGDLAAMLVTGGSATLTRIANQGGYTTPFADYSDRIKQQFAIA